jgi:hypothetical protein
MYPRVHAALCRAMPRFQWVGAIIVGGRLTHNAGVGSSSLPPATFDKSRLYQRLHHAFGTAARLARRVLGTTSGTKPLRNVRLELDLRKIELDRELLHHRLAMRSGTVARWER